jgi:hypothetical protein
MLIEARDGKVTVRFADIVTFPFLAVIVATFCADTFVVFTVNVT